MKRVCFSETFVSSYESTQRHIFVKTPQYKFHENPFSGSPAVTCGQTNKERQTDIAKLIGVFCDLYVPED
jgi:hypothetical protein